MSAAQPFSGIIPGGAADYLVYITSTIRVCYGFDMACRVLKPPAALIGVSGITVYGGTGRTAGYSRVYIVPGILAAVAFIAGILINDSFAGLKQPVAADLKEFENK